MKRLAAILLLCLAGLPARAVDADLYVNFNDVPAGTTMDATLFGLICKSNGSAFTYTWLGTANKVSIQNDSGPGLWRPVSVAGISYTNATPTRALLCQADNGVTPQKMTFDFVHSRKVSWGYSMILSNWTKVGNNYNSGGVENGINYNVNSIIDNNPIIMQAENISAPYGEDINVDNGIPIWVMGLWDSANSSSRHLYYNLTNGTLIGWSIAPQTLNATVNTFTWGITDNHTRTTGTDYRLNNLILYTNGNVWPVWPGGNTQLPTNSSGAAITAAIAAMSNGDTLFLPATNITITSGLTFNKTGSTMTSVLRDKYGTNKSVILADGVIDGLTVSGDYNTVTNFTITGDGSNDEATGIVSSGAHNVYRWMLLSELAVGFYAQNSGLLRESTILDCDISARNIFGDAYFNTWGPFIAYNSTNTMVYEDGKADWTAGKNATGASPIFSSQEGQSFTIRHWTSSLNKAGCDVAPVIDYHGDWDPGSNYMPGLLLQVYKYDVTIGSSSISGNKFIDARGWVFDAHSNTVFGATYDSDKGIVMREEHPYPGDQIPWVITNSYVAYNLDNGGAHAMAINPDANVVINVNYFATLSGQPKLQYPHPDTGLPCLNCGGGGGPSDAVTARNGSGAQVGRATRNGGSL